MFKLLYKNLKLYMVKNQLFRVLPDTEIIQKLLETFGLTSLEDTNYFTKDTLKDLQTVDKIVDLKETLSSYYLPCKAKVYLNHINEKKCITIFRQFLKVYSYTLISKERYINRKKLCVYRLIKLDEKPPTSPKKKTKNIVISFE